MRVLKKSIVLVCLGLIGCTSAAQTPPTSTPAATPPPGPAQQPTSDQDDHPIYPSNGPDEWFRFDSPNEVLSLLFDGTYLWAGSRIGGLVQWDPDTLVATRHTQATGFPLSTVNDLALHGGWLYAVGQEGLAIWDGQSWTHVEPTRMGFEPGVALNAVAVEVASTLWIGAMVNHELGRDWGGGLAHGDWQEGDWQFFQAPDPLLSNQINDLAIDEGGNVWVASGDLGVSMMGSFPGGLSRRSVNGRWTHYKGDDGSGLMAFAVGPVLIDGRGNLYAGSDDALNVLPPGKDSWRSVEVDRVRGLARGANGEIWILASEGLLSLTSEGLARIFPSGAEEWSGAIGLEDDFYLSRGPLVLDGEGDVWFAVGPAGLFELGQGAASPRTVLSALPSNEIYDVAANGDGSVWIRSGQNKRWMHSGGTISRIADGGIRHFDDEKAAIEAAFPWTATDSLWVVDQQGTIWFNDDHAFWGYDGGGWREIPWDRLASGDLEAFAAGQNALMAAIDPEGLHLYEPGRGWQAPARPPLTEEESYRWFAFPEALVVDDANDVWIGAEELGFGYAGEDGGVFRYSIRERKWTVFGDEAGGLPHVAVLGLAVSPQEDEIWAVNWGGMLAVHRQGAWKVLGEREERLRHLAIGQAGELWMTTLEPCGHESVCPGPVVRYALSAWQTFTPQNSGLTDLSWHGIGGVLDVGLDPSGGVWLATETGLQSVEGP